MKNLKKTIKSIKKWTSEHKTLFALIVTVVFILSQIPFLANHEIWDDEATSWQLSQEINFTNVYDVNSAEPHPILWQLILAPFSKLGFPPFTMNIISLLLVAAAVFLIFRFGPMNFFVKMAFLLSFGMFYFLPVIARDYSIVPLAATTVCLAYKKRHEKPFLYGLSLAFLSQTHFLACGFVGAAAIGFVIESFIEKKEFKEFIKEFFFFSLPIFISIFSMIPIVIGSINNQAIITREAGSVKNVTDPLLANIIYQLYGNYSDISKLVFLILVSLIFATFLARNIKTFIYLISGIGVWVFVMEEGYKWYGFLMPKIAISFFMIFIVIWMNKTEETDEDNIFARLFSHIEFVRYIRKNITKNASIAVASVFVFLTFPYSLSYAIKDINMPFTNTYEVSDYFNETFEPGSLVIESDSSSMIEPAVYLFMNKDIDIYSEIKGRLTEKMDYLKYDNDRTSAFDSFEGLSNEELEKKIAEFSEKYEHIYYLAAPSNISEITAKNREVLNRYERIGTLNKSEYLDVSRVPLLVFKIK